MKRIATVIAIICLVTVSALENSILSLCVLIGYEVSCAASAPESIPTECESCCAYEKSCGFEEAYDYEDVCTASGFEPIELEAVPADTDSTVPQWTLAQPCTCVRSGPPLIGIIQEYQPREPELLVSDLLSPGPQFDKSMGDSFPESARSPSIHPLISTTVIRL